MLAGDANIHAAICSIFTAASLYQARQFSNCNTLELAELDANYTLGEVVSRQMILVVISADELLITFRILFNISEAEQLRKIKFSRPNEPEQAAAAITLDYMKELSNQTCGRICRVFQLNNLSLGMSIPLSMHGFYERYSDYTPHSSVLKKFGHAWRIIGDFGSMVCTAQVEIANPNAVANLQYLDEPPPNDDEELEFL